MDKKALRTTRPRMHSLLAMEIQENRDVSSKHRKAYLVEQKMQQESDDGKRVASALQILKDVNYTQNECMDKIEFQIRELKTNLYNLIVDELGYEERTIKKIEFHELEQIINECLPALKMLKKVCAAKEVKERAPRTNHSVYELLFNDLIALDARFAVFAPARSINKNEFKSAFSKLPASLSLEIERVKKRLKKNEKADYVALYQVVEFEQPNSRVEKSTEMMKPLKKEVSSTISKMIKTAEQMKKDIYQYFVDQIEIYKDKNGKVCDEKMQDIIMVVRSAKNKLAEIVNNRYVIKKANWETDIVQDLLDELQLLDPRIEFVDLSVGVTE